MVASQPKPQAGEIRTRGLWRRFGTHVAVQPFDLEIGPGGVTGLLGPNGSGKSTFLRMALGLVRPHGGEAQIDGAVLRGDGREVRRRATYMPGEIAVYGELSGKAHLRWLLRGRERGAFARALSLAGELGLPVERRVRGYSHGMKRQLFLAAALGPDVRVRILDEPTEGLDPTKRRQVLDLLEGEAREGRTVLLSSHHLAEMERSSTRMLFLRRGELLDQETAGAIHRRARRALRVTWGEVIDDAELRRALEPLGARSSASDTEVRVEDGQATILARSDDPRATLLELLALENLPAPASLTFGELSLRELYRELYGEEGV